MNDSSPSTSEEKCANCGTAIASSSRFCAGCGQSTEIKRITFRKTIADALDHVLDYEQPLVRTVANLAWRPGWVAKRYVEGQRKSFTNPIKLCILAVAVQLVTMALLGFRLSEFIDSQVPQDQELNELARQIIEISRYAAVFGTQYRVPFTILTLPALAIVLRLLFWNQRRNTAEFFVMSMFVYSECILIQSVGVPLTMWVTPFALSIGTNLPLIYIPLAMCQFVAGNRWLVILKSLVACFIYFVFAQFVALGLGYLLWVKNGALVP